jgi:hypothetical protein
VETKYNEWINGRPTVQRKAELDGTKLSSRPVSKKRERQKTVGVASSQQTIL